MRFNEARALENKAIRLEEIRAARKFIVWIFIGSNILLWSLAFFGRSPDMYALAQANLYVGTIMTLSHRIRSKKEWDRLTTPHTKK